MKRIASAENPAHAHLIVAMLEEHGIEAVVQGEALWAARGELPFTPESAPSIWVASAADAIRARELVEQYDLPAAPSKCPGCGYDLSGLSRPRCPECGRNFRLTGQWRCPGCGESVDLQFTQCWNCDAERPDDAMEHARTAYATSTRREDVDAAMADPYCRSCLGTGRERRVVLPTFLLLLALIYLLTVVDTLDLRRFPRIDLSNLPATIAGIVFSTALLWVAYYCRTRKCPCTSPDDDGDTDS